jgi:hypothetical protein
MCKKANKNIFLFLQCGRFVTDELVSLDEAHQLLKLAKKGLAKGGGAGGASILGNTVPVRAIGPGGLRLRLDF